MDNSKWLFKGSGAYKPHWKLIRATPEVEQAMDIVKDDGVLWYAVCSHTFVLQQKQKKKPIFKPLTPVNSRVLIQAFNILIASTNMNYRVDFKAPVKIDPIVLDVVEDFTGVIINADKRENDAICRLAQSNRFFYRMTTRYPGDERDSYTVFELIPELPNDNVIDIDEPENLQKHIDLAKLKEMREALDKELEEKVQRNQLMKEYIKEQELIKEIKLAAKALDTEYAELSTKAASYIFNV